LTIKDLLDENMNLIVQSIGNNYYQARQKQLWEQSFSKLLTFPSILQLTQDDLIFVSKFVKSINPKTNKFIYKITKENLNSAIKSYENSYRAYLISQDDQDGKIWLFNLYSTLKANNFFPKFSDSELVLFKKDFVKAINTLALTRLFGYLGSNKVLEGMFIYNVLSKKKSQYIPVADDAILWHFIKLNLEVIVDFFSIEIVQLPQYNRCKDYNELRVIVKSWLLQTSYIVN
jgi:hypothetical protein